MRKMNDLTKSKLTRRTFLQGMAATGAAATLAGCSTDDGELLFSEGATSTTTAPEVQLEFKRYIGTSGHNCGGGCLSIAEVSNGKIHRILTDQTKFTSDGTYVDKNGVNWTQHRNCTKCRSYQYRLYHPGRLMYPMKQTKKRGDLSGFQRISWEQAFREIAAKQKNVIDKYGMDAIYSLMAFGGGAGAFNGAGQGPFGGSNFIGGHALHYMGGAVTNYFASYSDHQAYFLGKGYTGMSREEGLFTNTSRDFAMHINGIRDYTNNVVLWGDNRVTTAHNNAHSYTSGFRKMKERDANAKIYFVGPHFSDSGVALADEWMVSKPYTDGAIIAGMIYHMLDNTFDLTNGTLKADPWLKIDYIDTLVYGFFDSPAYSMTEATGDIAAAEVTVSAGNRNVPAIESGKSYASWILGNNNNAPEYSATTTNYTAKQYETISTGFKRWAACSLDKPANTVYRTKLDYNTPKTPAWASAISGVPEEAIKRLAEVYAKGGIVASSWSGGMQKQGEGVSSLYALQALHVITQNVSKRGTGCVWEYPSTGTADPKSISSGVIRGMINSARTMHTTQIAPNLGYRATTSCISWHTAIKMAYSKELKAGGYTAQHIPNFNPASDNPIDNIYWDDGSTKTYVSYRRNADGTMKTYTDGTGTYYDWEGRTGTDGNGGDGTPAAHNGTPIIAGIRMMYNPGGNSFVNQHTNSNDSKEILEALPINNGDADTFCLISIDNFLTATPRWSDYVLPATTYWEQQDMQTTHKGSTYYMPAVSTPPGESKQLWDIAVGLLRESEKIGLAPAGSADDYTGGNKTIETFVKEAFATARQDATSPYFGKTWEQYLEDTHLAPKPDEYKVPNPNNMALMNKFLALSASDLADNPFVKKTGDTATDNYVPTNEVDNPEMAAGHVNGGYGNEFSSMNGAPKSPLRYQAASPVMVWQYNNRFSKWHGWVPAEKRGQNQKDLDGNDFVSGLPIYYAYEDYYMDAYGGNDKLTDLKFLLTTSHPRYRAHSSMAENPMLRELTHRVPGRDAKGKFIPANDWDKFGNGPAEAPNVGEVIGEYPAPTETIQADGSVTATNKGIASYSEIFMNNKDAADLGILDGDLLEVRNPIGVVHVVARLTSRCAIGYVDLHEGSWYDPRMINGELVDVGGCANTLMSSQPSRIDHGNAAQAAMVSIKKLDY